MKKTIKVPFEVIIRNKKTGKEIKVGDVTIPVGIRIDKKQLQDIMKDNVKKESDDITEH